MGRRGTRFNKAGQIRVREPRRRQILRLAPKDQLLAWLNGEGVRPGLALEGEVDITLVQQVLTTAYAADLDDIELATIGRDPFLIAQGVAAPAVRTVVSNEVSKNSQRRARRKVPDACRDVGVACCNTFAMLRALDWRTGWRN